MHTHRASGIDALDAGTAIVGQACPVQCRGEPGLRALLVVGRGRAARTHVVQIDAAGRAQASVPVLAADWPDLDVALATVRGQRTLRVPVLLRPEPVVKKKQTTNKESVVLFHQTREKDKGLCYRYAK